MEEPSSGKNKLYNLLNAFALYDVDVGYMQGMNFIAALVLKVFDEESLAWFVFIRILQINEWRRLYLENTPKLFELSRVIRQYLLHECPKLYQRIKYHDVSLEPLLASPFITIFANLLDIESAERALERFILMGEIYVIDTLKQLFKANEQRLVQMDAWDMQVFIGRKMYQQAIEKEEFFSSNIE